MGRTLLLIGMAAAVLTGAGTAVAAQGGLLGGIAEGLWELRGRDGAVYARACVGDRWRLAQVAHGGRKCDRFIKSDPGDTLEVSYSCPGHGQGSTLIRKETDRLLQIHSSGVADGSPFDLTLEARRVGRC